MRDVVFLLMVGGFFALAALYVRACSAVVGSTSQPQATDVDADLEDAA